MIRVQTVVFSDKTENWKVGQIVDYTDYRVRVTRRVPIGFVIEPLDWPEWLTRLMVKLFGVWS